MNHSTDLRRRVLYDLKDATVYHSCKNCPAVEALVEEQRRICTEQIALSKTMRKCDSCVSMDRHESLPWGVPVEPTAKIGVALSGGGHRATLFGLGVLMYLVHARRNEEMSLNNDVYEIASVSGGSITNAHIAQSLDYQWATPEEFSKVAGRLASQIALRGTLFAPWWSRAYVASLLVLTLVAFGGLASVLLLRGSWSPFWAVLGGGSVALLLVVGILAQWRGTMCEKAFIRTLFSVGGSPTKLSALARNVLHVICATEVQTGNAAYFSPGFVYCKDFEPRHPEDLDLASAVQASAALPVAFPPCRIRAKPDSRYPSAWRAVKRKPRGLLLVDGGVRDNLGADWFTHPARSHEIHFTDAEGRPLCEPGEIYPGRVLPLPEVDQLIVVSGAANRIEPRYLRAHRPFLGELSSLLKLSDLPYNTRESKTRRALLWQFASAPSLQNQEGRLRVSGAVLHIEESPCELAEDLLLSLENWNTPPEKRSSTLNRAWSNRSNSDSATVENVDLLDWNLLRVATGRAEELLGALAEAETDEDLEVFAREHRAMMESVRERLNPGGAKDGKPLSRRELVSIAWHRRAADNAAVSTHLSRMGVETTASLVRHGFVLAMAKLHLLLDYPLCTIPSAEEFRQLASGHSDHETRPA